MGNCFESEDEFGVKNLGVVVPNGMKIDNNTPNCIMNQINLDIVATGISR